MIIDTEKLRESLDWMYAQAKNAGLDLSIAKEKIEHSIKELEIMQIIVNLQMEIKNNLDDLEKSGDPPEKVS